MNLVQADAVPSAQVYTAAAFTKPSYDTTVLKTEFKDFYPVSGVKNLSTIRWTIPPAFGSKVYDPSQAVLYARVKVTKKDHTAPPSTSIEASLCDQVLWSLFKSLRITYNGQQVCYIRNFPMYCYLKNVLSKTPEDYNYMVLFGAIRDTPAEHWDTNNGDNFSWEQRRLLFGGYTKDPDDPENEVFKFSNEATTLIGCLPNYLQVCPPQINLVHDIIISLF